MEKLSVNSLLQAYILAKKIGLDPDFIKLLELELRRRSVNLKKIMLFQKRDPSLSS
ncbi:sporulation histidine kinase inhibitor Sda [Sporosarcina sp. Te-1]|uniref:sporulation histidine kinase inhibitor Sda n=1 Tax=Sporosarcina sp. Te-1 TaxID=2818390 RepID=UPI001A9FD850|nr:sporulation histidine kinase inhibitor Sda [Sporosarcina sp. Te-1]QTD43084.1 sporulation histidine kinase inhibitor Sda [Sporosarcina sp. Te-1]